MLVSIENHWPKMQSQAVLSMGIQDLASMAKGDVSKTLFGQIQWEEISKSGVFLTHLEVSSWS